MDTLEVLSSPRTGPYWASPLYDKDSREFLAEKPWNAFEKGKDSSEDISRWLDIGSGSGLYVEEAAVNYPESGGKGSGEVFAEMLDMSPPEYAREVASENDNIELIEGKAPEDIPDREYDFVSLLNAGQYFDDDEFSVLVDEVHGSLASEGRFLFNSVHPLIDLFRDLEDYSDKSLVRYEDGKECMETRVRIDPNEFDVEKIGVEETLEGKVVQTPRRFTDYLMEILGDERFSPEDFGTVESFNDPLGLAKCIEPVDSEGVARDESIMETSVEYPFGIVKKNS